MPSAGPRIPSHRLDPTCQMPPASLLEQASARLTNWHADIRTIKILRTVAPCGNPTCPSQGHQICLTMPPTSVASGPSTTISNSTRCRHRHRPRLCCRSRISNTRDIWHILSIPIPPPLTNLTIACLTEALDPLPGTHISPTRPKTLDMHPLNPSCRLLPRLHNRHSSLPPCPSTIASNPFQAFARLLPRRCYRLHHPRLHQSQRSRHRLVLVPPHRRQPAFTPPMSTAMFATRFAPPPKTLSPKQLAQEWQACTSMTMPTRAMLQSQHYASRHPCVLPSLTLTAARLPFPAPTFRIQ